MTEYTIFDGDLKLYAEATSGWGLAFSTFLINIVHPWCNSINKFCDDIKNDVHLLCVVRISRQSAHIIKLIYISKLIYYVILLTWLTHDHKIVQLLAYIGFIIFTNKINKSVLFINSGFAHKLTYLLSHTL